MTLTEAITKSGLATLSFYTKRDITRYYATNTRMYRELLIAGEVLTSEVVPVDEWALVVNNREWRAMGYGKE